MVHTDHTKGPSIINCLDIKLQPHHIINSNPSYCVNYNKYVIKNDFLAFLALSSGIQTSSKKF